MALPIAQSGRPALPAVVDEAKTTSRRRPRSGPITTVDPGVTLIETFAYLVDIALNGSTGCRRRTTRFLDLLGIRLFPRRPPGPMWTSCCRAAPTCVVAGRHRGRDAALGHRAGRRVRDNDDLPIVPSELVRWSRCPCRRSGGPDHDLRAGLDVAAFQARPAPGDAMALGLRWPCALHRGGTTGQSVEGRRRRPRQPPLVWEAWDGAAGRMRDRHGHDGRAEPAGRNHPACPAGTRRRWWPGSAPRGCVAGSSRQCPAAVLRRVATVRDAEVFTIAAPRPSSTPRQCSTCRWARRKAVPGQSSP